MRRHHVNKLVIILIIVITCTPWLSGTLFKRQYFQLIDLLNTENHMKVEILEYHQGWLTSDSKVRITFNSALTGLTSTNLPISSLITPVSITIEEVITHGPIIYDTMQNRIQFGYANIHNLLNVPKDIETSLVGKLQSEGAIQVDAVSKFGGNWCGIIHIPAMTYAMQNTAKIAWLGLNGDFRIQIKNNHIKHAIVNLLIGSVLFQNDINGAYLAGIIVQPMKYQYDSLHQKLGIWSGFSTLYTRGISINNRNGTNIVAGNMYINTKYGFNSDTVYNTNITLNIKNLTTPSPVNPVYSEVYIGLSASDFNSKGLSNYLNFIKNKTTTALNTLNSKTIERLLVSTINPTSIIESEISSNTAFGQFNIRTKTTWKNNTPTPTTFSEIIPGSYTTINVKASYALTNEIIKFLSDHIKFSTLMTQPRNVILATNASPPGENSDAFKKQVAQLLNQKKISYTESLQILALEKRNQSIEIFSSYMDNLKLPSDVISQLKEAYSTLMANTVNSATTPTSPHGTPETIVSDLVKIGYIGKDKNDYVTTFTIENGVTKINGRDLASLLTPQKPVGKTQ